MAIVRSYRTCDICGKILPHDVDKWNYHIEPPSKLKIGIWKHTLRSLWEMIENMSCLLYIQTILKKHLSNTTLCGQKFLQKFFDPERVKEFTKIDETTSRLG